MQTPPPVPLDYALSQSRPFPWRQAVLFVGLWTVGLCVLLMPMVFIVPHFAVVFRDFNSPLPFPTVALIACSQWLVHYGLFLIAGAVAGFSGAAVFGLRENGERRIRRVLLASLAFLVGLFVLEMLFVVVGLIAPMTTLIQSVSHH